MKFTWLRFRWIWGTVVIIHFDDEIKLVKLKFKNCNKAKDESCSLLMPLNGLYLKMPSAVQKKIRKEKPSVKDEADKVAVLCLHCTGSSHQKQFCPCREKFGFSSTPSGGGKKKVHLERLYKEVIPIHMWTANTLILNITEKIRTMTKTRSISILL